MFNEHHRSTLRAFENASLSSVAEIPSFRESVVKLMPTLEAIKKVASTPPALKNITYIETCVGNSCSGHYIILMQSTAYQEIRHSIPFFCVYLMGWPLHAKIQGS